MTISALVFDPSNNPLPGVSVLFTATDRHAERDDGALRATASRERSCNTTQTTTVTAIAGAGEGRGHASTASRRHHRSPLRRDTGTVGRPCRSRSTLRRHRGNSTPAPDCNAGRRLRRRHDRDAHQRHRHRRRSRTPISSAGGYTITATATDVSGNTGIASDAIVISHAPLPTVTLTASPNPCSRRTQCSATITVTATAQRRRRADPQRVASRSHDGTVIYSGTGQRRHVRLSVHCRPEPTRSRQPRPTRTASHDATGAMAAVSHTSVVTVNLARSDSGKQRASVRQAPGPSSVL